MGQVSVHFAKGQQRLPYQAVLVPGSHSTRCCSLDLRRAARRHFRPPQCRKHLHTCRRRIPSGMITGLEVRSCSRSSWEFQVPGSFGLVNPDRAQAFFSGGSQDIEGGSQRPWRSFFIQVSGFGEIATLQSLCRWYLSLSLRVHSIHVLRPHLCSEQHPLTTAQLGGCGPRDPIHRPRGLACEALRILKLGSTYCLSGKCHLQAAWKL